MAGCPGQAWGNLVSLVSHGQGCCDLAQMQRVQKPQQESLVTAVALGSGVRSLVTSCEAGQVRQDLQNVNTAKLAVVVSDILIGLVLSKCHGCSASGVTRTLAGWDGLRWTAC